MAVRLVIADDHTMVRTSLRMYFEADPDIDIVGEARDGREALALARTAHPDVVLMDLLMPSMNGIEATKVIRTEMPDIEVVAMTSVLGDAAVPDAINAGVIACVLKDTHPQELRRAILAAADGQVVFAAGSAYFPINKLQIPGTTRANLGDAEVRLLRLVAAGRSNSEIAAETGLGLDAVREAVRDLLKTLQLRGRAQAVLYALQHGFASADDTSAFPPDTGRSHSTD